MSRPFPIIEYAQKIKKNTKDFTANDMVQFTRWWMKQPVRKDILAMSSFKQSGAQTGRMKDQVGALKEVSKSVEPVIQESEVICEIGLTKADVKALLWGLNELITTYDFSEHENVGETLTALHEVLSEVEVD